MAVAAPFVPMMIGAGVGAIMDKGNPLRGAMLGAVGGTVAGPAMSGLTAGGSAASSAALGAGMGSEAATAAAQTAAMQGATGLAAESPMYNAMIGDQIAGMGTQGLSHYATSAGANPIMSKLGSMAVGGPQGMIQAMGNGPMGLKDMMGMGSKGMGLISKLGGGQPQGGAPAAMAAPSRPMPAPQPQRMQPFQTGPVIGARPNGPMIRGMR